MIPLFNFLATLFNSTLPEPGYDDTTDTIIHDTSVVRLVFKNEHINLSNEMFSVKAGKDMFNEILSAFPTLFNRDRSSCFSLTLHNLLDPEDLNPILEAYCDTIPEGIHSIFFEI